MQNSHYSKFFETLNLQFLESERWFANYLDVPEMANLKEIKSTLNTLKSLPPDESTNFLLNNQTPELIQTMFDAEKICQTIYGLKKLENKLELPDHIKDKLLTELPGINLKGNDHFRDTLFELFIGARLISNGIPVKFTEKKADIITSLNGYTIFVECKRSQSKPKVFTRLREGIDQLETRYTRGRTKEVGIVFHSLENVIDSHVKIRKVKNWGDVIKESTKIVEYFGLNPKKYRNRLKKMPNKKTIGYFPLGMFLYFVENTNTIVFRQYYVGSSFFETLDNQYFEIFNQLLGKFKLNSEYHYQFS